MWPLILFAPLLLATATAEEPAPGGQAIVFLSSSRSRPEKRGIDENLLLDAVAIYTRDLGLTVLRVSDPPPTALTPATTDEVVALLRARAARLGFWCQLLPDGRSLELVTLDVRKQVTRQSFVNDPVPGVDLYRAMALKIRVMVVGADNPGSTPPTASAGVAAPPASSTASSSPGAAAGPAAPGNPAKAGSGRDAPPTTVPAVPETLVEPAPASSPPGFLVGAGYALSLPSGSASWRHAGVLHVIASLQAPLEGELGVELAPSDGRSTAVGSLSVTDVPVRLGLRVVRRSPSSILGLGVIAGVHLLFARAIVTAPDTATERTWTATGAGGLEFVARTGLKRGLAPELRLWVELRVPRTRFLVREMDPRFEVGAVGAGVSLGVTFPRQ